MADMDYYGADYGAEAPSRVMDAMRNFGLVNWAGAATSLTLTAGLAVWAVDLTFGDVSAVPVIQAIEGPMRVAPEDPGGTNMPYQGLALADITSGGSAAPAPDKIMLAPPPVALDAPSLAERREAAEAAEAAAVETAEAPAAEAAETVETAEAPAVEDEAPLDETMATLDAAGTDEENPGVEAGGTVETATAEPEAPIDAEAEALIEQLASQSILRGTKDVTLLSVDASADLSEEAESAGNTATPLAEGLSRSSRPRSRPAALRAVAAAGVPQAVPAVATAADAIAPATAETAAATPELDAASVAAGTRIVQLGAFDSEAIARAEWARVQGSHGDYLAGHPPIIQKASTGGRDFWRLRVAGFDDAADARRLCAALLDRQQACIPVTVR